MGNPPLLIALFTDEAKFGGAVLVVPAIADLRPNVHTVLVAAGVVRFTAAPQREVHEAVGPQLARLRRHVPPDLLRGSVEFPVPDARVTTQQMPSRPQEGPSSESVAARKSSV